MTTSSAISLQQSQTQTGTGQATKVEIRNLSKTFQRPDGSAHGVLDTINLSVPRGSFTAIVGPSGCGKSTLLSIIAGLEPYQRGDVRIDGQQVRGVQRGIGFLFQHDALMPWRNVRDNVALGLELQKFPKQEIHKRVAEWIGRIGLRGFERHYPSQLSGGMRKRVSLAQSLVYEPDLILMDEPYSALDVQTRNAMENDLLRIFDQSGNTTVIFITHDLEEAIALSDRVVLMTAGPDARVKAVYEVTLPRPRDVINVRATATYAQIYTAIWNSLREEVGRQFEATVEYEI